MAVAAPAAAQAAQSKAHALDPHCRAAQPSIATMMESQRALSLTAHFFARHFGSFTFCSSKTWLEKETLKRKLVIYPRQRNTYLCFKSFAWLLSFLSPFRENAFLFTHE